MSYSYQKQFKNLKHIKSVFKWWKTSDYILSLCYFPISLHPTDIVVYISYRKSRDKLSSRINIIYYYTYTSIPTSYTVHCKWVHKRCSGISGKLKSNTDFHCRRCLEGENGLFQSVLLKEVVIEPNVKLECVPKFCYLGDTLGAGGGVEEAARARVRCAWAKFKELSPILTARGASYRIKGKIYKACVQSALTYGTETWAMKKANLQSLERTEQMMVRWMCGVSLKDRKRSVDLYSLLGVQSVDEVVRRGRWRWFGHVERKSGDDWASASRNVVVPGVRCAGRGRKTWYECVKDDMKALGLHPEWAVFRDMWRGFISGGTSNPSWAWRDWCFKNKWWWWWLMSELIWLFFSLGASLVKASLDLTHLDRSLY